MPEEISPLAYLRMYSKVQKYFEFLAWSWMRMKTTNFENLL